MDFPEIVERFGNYQTVVKNRSVKTVYQYKRELTLFLRYIKELHSGRDPAKTGSDLSEVDAVDMTEDDVAAISKEDILSYIMYAATSRENHANARARKLSCLRTFFKYCAANGIIDENPTLDIDSPKVKQALPKYLTLEESITLLEAVRNDVDSKTRARDHAILTIFLNCGLRLSELVGINISNISSDLSLLRVLGKGSKERIVYLNDACKSALSEYLIVRNDIETIPKDKDALFVSRKNRRISNQMVQVIVHKYLDIAGLGYRQLSTHKLRHTAATLMYRTGEVDIRVLKDILGHEELSTTQIYTHVSDEQMHNAMMKNPLSKMGEKKKD